MASVHNLDKLSVCLGWEHRVLLALGTDLVQVNLSNLQSDSHGATGEEYDMRRQVVNWVLGKPRVQAFVERVRQTVRIQKEWFYLQGSVEKCHLSDKLHK